MIAIMKRYPVTSYFLLAITISWVGILTIVMPTTFPAPESEATRLFVAVYLAMLAGPSIAGLTMTALVGGRDGLHEYWNRLRVWRVGVRWYAAALLFAPMALALTLLALSLVSTDFVPAILSDGAATAGLLPVESVSAFVLMGLAVGVGAGFFEELGWSGFAVPRMLSKHTVVATGGSVGLVWGAWHFLAIFWGSAGAVGAVPMPVYLLIALFSFLVPYRILMTWVYQRTESTLIGVLMHASLTSSMLIMGAPVSGYAVLMYDLVFGAVLWIAVAIVFRKSFTERSAARSESHPVLPVVYGKP